MEECPLVGSCCTEDCCGKGTPWNSTYCVNDPDSPGFNGTYSADWDPGCVERLCCESTCCSPGQEFDETTGFCLPSDGDVTVVNDCGMMFTIAGMDLILEADLECGGDDDGILLLAGDDITLDCNGYSLIHSRYSGSDPYVDGIIVSEATNVRIRNCAINGRPEDGILVIDGASATIENSESNENGRHGFRFNDGGSAKVYDSTFDNNGSYGVFSVGNLFMENSSASNNGGSGVSVVDGTASLINVVAESNGDTNIPLHEGTATTLDGVVACFSRADDQADIENQGIIESSENITCDIATGPGASCDFDCEPPRPPEPLCIPTDGSYVSDYFDLKDKITNANPNDVNALCGNGIPIITTDYLVLDASNVTLCCAGPGSCTIKTNEGQRHKNLVVYGRDFTMRNIIFVVTHNGRGGNVKIGFNSVSRSLCHTWM